MSANDPRLSQLAPQLSALRCAYLLAAHHGVALDPELLPAVVEGDMAASVAASLGKAGFRVRLDRRCDWARATKLGSAFPALALLRGGHWIVLVDAIPDANGQIAAAVLDPRCETRGVHLVSRADFEADWTGALLLARHAPRVTDDRQPFGLAWFLPELLRQGSLLRGVALAAVIGNLIAFSIPLLLQVLIDRVIAHQAWNTLTVVVAIFLLIASFDAVFTYVRQRLMMIAGGKVDAKLGSRAFAHLLSLPMSVFEGTPSGVLARHMQQTEKLRQFLTGRLLQTLLDAALLPVLLTLLAIYSGLLTLLVLGFAAAIAGSIAALLPLFRRRLTALYLAEADRQAHLVETLHNMRAVKALVLEPGRQRAWDASLVGTIRRQWDVGNIGALAGAVTGWLEKLMQISILAVGAMLVFQGGLTLGALVAFTMLSSKVTGPLVQIVGLISEYQEALLSVRMLATVMDHPTETSGQARPGRPPILGRLRFEAAGFTWPGAGRPALDALSFEIEPGQVIGVVGRSGSGKTTLTRLIQGIETPGAGRILLDGVDIRHIDLAHLRRGVGVVLQENMLFRGTVRENIAAARPEASLDEVIAAARLAGADEFIARMPLSYETRVEEGGANLSGGQRQRVAIARALLTAPRLLVFDEATSALDPESEALVNRNLADMARGRTMIVVSHRLSTLVRSDAILVLDGGRVADFAPHATLLGRCEIYRGLWQQQTEHMS
ncbi:peptidase domain-containing ABC transporter [Amaricoccus sp.]|uniref:peptidase domain-containing ABC transporter n=1 Tax=Amaricoccus sp. TaxID=1872485 RepID=UPI00261991F2|nr:peptidase domain-containing ABC transporter [uncultured Amaricoccus sp.]